jgi:hypothetical protein
MPLRRPRGGGNALGLLMDEGDKVAVRTPMEYSSPTAKFRNTRAYARESSKVSWEPTGTLTPIDVDARPNRNSRDCSYAVTQFEHS